MTHRLEERIKRSILLYEEQIVVQFLFKSEIKNAALLGHETLFSVF